MDVSFIAIVMIVAIVIIAIVIYKSVSSADGRSSSTAKAEESKLHLGTIGAEKSTYPGTTTPPASRFVPSAATGSWSPTSNMNSGGKSTHKNHSVERIYVCAFPSNIWICPDCECENDFSRRSCCVCNKQR